MRLRPLSVLTALAGVMVLTIVAVPGTLAFWVGEDDATTAPLEAANLDVTLNGQLTGPGGTIVDTGFTVSGLIPGESFARVVTVGNGGSIPLDYSMSGHTTGPLGSALRWTAVVGGTADNSGSPTAGTRTGGCTGGTAVFGPAAISQSATAPTPMLRTPRSLSVGATERICVVVRLDPAAPGSLQGTAGTAAFHIEGRQRSAP